MHCVGLMYRFFVVVVYKCIIIGLNQMNITYSVVKIHISYGSVVLPQRKVKR
jgi:hypothetical protein